MNYSPGRHTDRRTYGKMFTPGEIAHYPLNDL